MGSMDKAVSTATILLHEMNAEPIGIAYVHNTDSISPLRDEDAMEQMKQILMKFNEAR